MKKCLVLLISVLFLAAVANAGIVNLNIKPVKQPVKIGYGRINLTLKSDFSEANYARLWKDAHQATTGAEDAWFRRNEHHYQDCYTIDLYLPNYLGDDPWSYRRDMCKEDPDPLVIFAGVPIPDDVTMVVTFYTGDPLGGWKHKCFVKKQSFKLNNQTPVNITMVFHDNELTVMPTSKAPAGGFQRVPVITSTTIPRVPVNR
jgi:hypothetical protein